MNGCDKQKFSRLADLFAPCRDLLPPHIQHFSDALFDRILTVGRFPRGPIASGLAELRRQAADIGHSEWLCPAHPAHREPNPMSGLQRLVVTLWNGFDPVDHPEAANIRCQHHPAPDFGGIPGPDAAALFLYVMVPFSVFLPTDERRVFEHLFNARWHINGEHAIGRSRAGIVAGRFRAQIEHWVGQLMGVLQPAARVLGMPIDDLIMIHNLVQLPELRNRVIGANCRLHMDFFPLPLPVRDLPELVQRSMRVGPEEEAIARLMDWRRNADRNCGERPRLGWRPFG
jgi:hypothetical protein